MCTVYKYVSPALDGYSDGVFSFGSPFTTAYLYHTDSTVYFKTQGQATLDGDVMFVKNSSFCAVRVPGYNNRFTVVATYSR